MMWVGCSAFCRATALLASERTAFEVEKKAHFELYERQQQVSYLIVISSGLGDPIECEPTLGNPTHL